MIQTSDAVKNEYTLRYSDSTSDDDTYEYFCGGDSGVVLNPWIDHTEAQVSTILNNNIALTDDSVIMIDDFQITGKDLKRYFKVLKLIVENDYPEELL